MLELNIYINHVYEFFVVRNQQRYFEFFFLELLVDGMRKCHPKVNYSHVLTRDQISMFISSLK